MLVKRRSLVLKLIIVMYLSDMVHIFARVNLEALVCK